MYEESVGSRVAWEYGRDTSTMTVLGQNVYSFDSGKFQSIEGVRVWVLFLGPKVGSVARSFRCKFRKRD